MADEEYLALPTALVQQLDGLGATWGLSRAGVIAKLLQRPRLNTVEALLKEQAAQRVRLEQVIEQLPVAVMIVDAQDRLVLTNPQVEQVWRAPLLGVLGHGQFFGRDGQPLERSRYPIARVFATQEPILDEEMTIQRGDGTRGLIRISAVPLLEQGQVTAVVTTFHDITEQKRTEQALRQSVELFQQLTGNIREVFWLATPDNRQLFYVSPLYEEMWGRVYRNREHPKVVLEALHPEDRVRVMAFFTQPITQAVEVEYRIVRPDQQVRWIRDRCFPVRNTYGQIFRVAGVSEDITERKEMEEALREQARFLTEVSRTKDEFIATLSHELRTPLTAILGFSQLLLQGRLNEQGRQRAVETIERNARAQNQLVEDLLDVSRIVSGKLRLELQTLNLLPVINSALETLLPQAEAKKQTLVAHLEPGVGTIQGDASRLQQVLWNLLNNAIKFTPLGGKITLTLTQQADWAVLAVTDTGQGIAPEFLPQVFDRFRQADSTSTRMYGGLGLGLAIVRHLVELHNGTIAASSPGLGQGATFTLRLPLLEPERSPQRVEPSLLSGLPPLDGLLILVVAATVTAREDLAQILESGAARVIAVGTAQDALEVLDQWQPDALVSDLELSPVHGLDLMRRIRVRPWKFGGQIPALAVMASTQFEDAVFALAAGYQTYLSWPIEPVVLLNTLATLTGRIRA
ncbi:ATP-binding protein [Candidatus Cyanaurora vandensis]|uniref:ATP-binding protein n=1 Tax=Candidatus Cyanaurora vandensis TaxID=2714958 RepID=UPI00257D4AA1|nr:ATP-binding protein [Candidatus Cyanaurora vandensis]